MAIKLDLAQSVSDEDLLRLSKSNPGYQFERTAGGRVLVSPTGSAGGRRSAEVVAQLHAWNQRDGHGVVFDSSTGFTLKDGSCLSPDASWVRRERWESLSPEAREGFAPLCPDAVFEVRSPSNTLAELREKMRSYLQNGAHIGVLVDPQTRSVEVYRPGQEIERYEGEGSVILAPELSAFTLDLNPIFAD